MLSRDCVRVTMSGSAGASTCTVKRSVNIDFRFVKCLWCVCMLKSVSGKQTKQQIYQRSRSQWMTLKENRKHHFCFRTKKSKFLFFCLFYLLLATREKCAKTLWFRLCNIVVYSGNRATGNRSLTCHTSMNHFSLSVYSFRCRFSIRSSLIRSDKMQYRIITALSAMVITFIALFDVNCTNTTNFMNHCWNKLRFC